jgi:hypothetical protein
MRIDKELQELHEAYDKCEMNKVYAFGALSRKFGVCKCGRAFIWFGRVLQDAALRLEPTKVTSAWVNVPRGLAAKQLRAERELDWDCRNEANRNRYHG